MKSKASNKYVTFMLGKTKFGIPVLKTKEIVEYKNIIPVPEAPDYILGVINLRGTVVPVVDLTKKFFNNELSVTESTSIMISEPIIDNEETLMGLVVDCVKDVLELKEENMENAPKYGAQLKSEYILKIANYDEEFIIIIDIDKVVSHSELQEDISSIVNKI